MLQRGRSVPVPDGKSELEDPPRFFKEPVLAEQSYPKNARVRNRHKGDRAVAQGKSLAYLNSVPAVERVFKPGGENANAIFSSVDFSRFRAVLSTGAYFGRQNAHYKK